LDLSLSIQGGGDVVLDESGSKPNFTFALSLIKSFEHSKIAFNAGSGWKERYFDPEKKSEFNLNYGVSFTKNFERGQIALNAGSQWQERYLDPEENGYTKNTNVGINSTYQIMKKLSSYGGVNFSKNEDQDNIGSKTLRGRCGLTFDISRWLAILLEYSYTDAIYSDETSNYRNNRFALTLTASKGYFF